MATKLSERERQKYKRILLIGDSGTGKTTILGTTTDVYIADFDGKLEVLGEREDIYADGFYDDYDNDKLASTAFAQFQPVLKAWQQEPKNGVFALDSFTSLADSVLLHTLLKARRAVPTQGDWGQAINDVKKVLGSLKKLRCHVIVTAHFQIMRDEQLGGLVLLPSVYGKALPGHVPAYFNDVWQTVLHFGKQEGGVKPVEYKLQVRPTSERFSSIKNSIGATTDFIEPNLSTILNTGA